MTELDGIGIIWTIDHYLAIRRDQMKRLVILIGLLVVFLLNACSATPATQEAMGKEQSTKVTVYRSPT